MEEGLKRYVVTVPEACVVDVVSELNRLGSRFDSIESYRGVRAIAVRVPEDNMMEFRQWLAETSRGEGTIHPRSRQ